MRCLNRKNMAVAGVVLAVVLLVRPSALGVVAPLLMMAICPLGMLFMMRGATCRRPDVTAAEGPELVELRAEVARLRAQEQAAAGDRPGLDEPR